MKKHITLLAILMSTMSISLTAQPVELGTNVISAGIGLGGRFGGFTYGSQTLGLSVHFEHGMWELGEGVVTIGGYAGTKSYKYSSNYASIYTYTQKWTYTIIGGRCAYHYHGIDSDNWDLYGGLMLSYNILNYKYEDNDPYPNDYLNVSYNSVLGLTGYVGARYFFNEKIGALAEAGYGVSYLTLGLAYKW